MMEALNLQEQKMTDLGTSELANNDIAVSSAQL